MLFVADMRGLLYVFDPPTLDLLAGHDTCDDPAGPLSSPHAMAAHEDELLVADHRNHRVLVFALPNGSPIV